MTHQVHEALTTPEQVRTFASHLVNHQQTTDPRIGLFAVMDDFAGQHVEFVDVTPLGSQLILRGPLLGPRSAWQLSRDMDITRDHPFVARLPLAGGARWDVEQVREKDRADWWAKRAFDDAGWLSLITTEVRTQLAMNHHYKYVLTAPSRSHRIDRDTWNAQVALHIGVAAEIPTFNFMGA